MFIRIISMGIIGFVGPDVFWVIKGDTLPYTEDQSFVVQIAFMFLLAGAAAVDMLHDAFKRNDKPGIASPDEIALHEKGIKPDHAKPYEHHVRCHGTGLVKDDKGRVMFCACMYAQT